MIENENDMRNSKVNENQNFNENLSEKIAEFILSSLNSCGAQFIQLRRKDLAEEFNCVPSQINYVLRSRFTPERGFLTDSQRGGHGYIQIERISSNLREDKLEHVSSIIGEAISYTDAKKVIKAFYERELISMRERILIELALKYISSLNPEQLGVSSYEIEMLLADMLERMLKVMVITDK